MKDISKYESIRNKMQTGDVIAFQGNDIGAKAIRKSTKSKYSHVGIVVRIKEIDVNRVFILESNIPSGVVLIPLRRKLQVYKGKAWWLPLKTDTFQTRYNPEVLNEGVRTVIYKWAMGELGKPYDFKMIRSIIKETLLKVKKIGEDDSQYICSEIVARAYKEVKILPTNITTRNITPEKITKLKILGSPIKLI